MLYERDGAEQEADCFNTTVSSDYSQDRADAVIAEKWCATDDRLNKLLERISALMATRSDDDAFLTRCREAAVSRMERTHLEKYHLLAGWWPGFDRMLMPH